MPTFKIGINRWTLPGNWDVKTCLRVAKESGFDAIEFNMDFEGALSPATSDADAQQIRRDADAMGVALSSLSTGVYWQKPFTHPDLQVRAESLELCRQQIGRAHV